MSEHELTLAATDQIKHKINRRAGSIAGALTIIDATYGGVVLAREQYIAGGLVETCAVGLGVLTIAFFAAVNHPPN